eukprot:PhM_4_TR10040/c2_g1_i8/m.99246
MALRGHADFDALFSETTGIREVSRTIDTPSSNVSRFGGQSLSVMNLFSVLPIDLAMRFAEDGQPSQADTNTLFKSNLHRQLTRHVVQSVFDLCPSEHVRAMVGFYAGAANVAQTLPIRRQTALVVQYLTSQVPSFDGRGGGDTPDDTIEDGKIGGGVNVNPVVPPRP